ncbi:amidohydrolase family protein [Govanella unica]|uniref:Amidohydrolase family protein n=1 Tax=Govanella unica TaxID=2975056 RepID=A0A9X3Z7B1_9PROT|nr:amidohydrolase family protein [Govania unica]MDA5193981.1 amidohydrolase family protein [Govania unica]
MTPVFSKSLVSLALAGLIVSTAARAENGLPMQPGRNLNFTVSSGTWMSLDVSPDGKSILFDLLGDIYRLDIKGGKAVPLLTGMAVETQPTYSPDGRMIAFISDRGGNENVWVAKADGSAARAISTLDNNMEFSSPAWSTDGKSVYVSHLTASLGVYELWQYMLDGSAPVRVTQGKISDDQPKSTRYTAVGAVASRDGKYLYYATRIGAHEDHTTFPAMTITRREIASGREEPVVSAQGSAFRPALSPDDRYLVYGTRYDSETGLRIHDLRTGEDRWLAYPVQLDQQEAFATSDILPRYSFTPDGKAIILSRGNKIKRIDVATGQATAIPFTADVKLGIGPSTRQDIREATGPVQARLVQTPATSPDGQSIAFSAMTQLYVMALDGSRPRLLPTHGQAAFHPSWSADGQSLTYITWDAKGGGHVWRMNKDGSKAVRLTREPGYYSNPIFTPDGRSVIALRSGNHARMHVLPFEFGTSRQADLVRIPLDGGDIKLIRSGSFGSVQFTRDAERIYLYGGDGLSSLRLDGSDYRQHLRVTGPGYYFLEGRFPVEDLRVSPDGKWAIVQIISEAYLVAIPDNATEVPVIDLGDPAAKTRKLTTIGADFIGWSDGGKTLNWTVGSTYFRLPLANVTFDKAPLTSIEKFPAIVEMPRDIPDGVILLRGATAITMKGDEVIEDADVLVIKNRIAAVGKRGTLEVPSTAEIRDISGQYVMPGFVDTHAHWAEIRRGVLDRESYPFLANLAYGVTAGLDVSTLTIDTLAYQDMIDAGMMIGPRAYSTSTAVFSFNEFQSLDHARNVLRRYKDYYRVDNLKEYRAGNRRQRQWVAMAAREIGLQPTTEGALNLKLDLSQIIDGFAGNEHTLVATPLGQDFVELVTRAHVSYSPTLIITHGGPPAYSHFYAANNVHDDPKVNHFFPHFAIDSKTRRGHWYSEKEFLYPRFAADAAKVYRAGGLLGVGSHSEFEGLAYHWEMQALASGGLTPHEVLKIATIGSSEVIGRKSELGSIEPGKFADLIILDKNPLLDIKNSLALRQVMKNGRLYNADTLDEVWPRQKPLPPLWFHGEAPPKSHRVP